MIDEVVEIPVRVINMLFVEHYFAAFYTQVQKGLTHAQAWINIEEELKKYGLPGRFDSYESFKSAKTYHYKKKAKPINFW